MSSNTTDYYDYGLLSDNLTTLTKTSQDVAENLNILRMLYIVGYLIICILGLPLNILVIITGCYSYHKLKKPITSMWVLALAMMHLLCSAFLPLQLLYAWYHFNWHYGAALCKLSSYVIYASMFTTATALSLWSVSNIVTSSNCCEGLRTRCRKSINKFMILSSCTFGVVLASPSLLSRELQDSELGLECIDDYDLEEEKRTDEGRKWLMVVVLCRFVLGILVPAFVMFISCCLAQRQQHGQDETCKRIICLMKITYFVCWTPVLVLGLLLVTETTLNTFTLPAATVLAAAHCCVNPVIYLLVGQSIQLKWMS